MSARARASGSSPPTAGVSSMPPAALWYCAVGYGRPRVADAVAEQLMRLPAYSFVRGRTRPNRPCSSATGSPPSRRSRTRGLLGFRRLGRRRHGGQARPPATGTSWASGQAGDRVSRARLSRMHRGARPGGMPVNRRANGGDINEEVVHVGWSDTESAGRAVRAARPQDRGVHAAKPVSVRAASTRPSRRTGRRSSACAASRCAAHRR